MMKILNHKVWGDSNIGIIGVAATIVSNHLIIVIIFLACLFVISSSPNPHRNNKHNEIAVSTSIQI